MHAHIRAKKITGTGGKDKTAVMGILERGGKVRVKVVPNRKKNALQAEIREHVLAGSALFTDSLKSYEGLDEFQHEVVDHAVEYVRGEVHTNGLENFWSLLKRGLNGTLYLEGYWQSEGYFKDVEAVIRADLTIAPPEDALNVAMAANIRARPCVAVHVRFFDAPGSGVHNAPADYYARAVAKMDALAPGSHYFLFSDRPEMARTLIPLPDERVTTVSHNRGDASAYADLWLMQQATHFIVANSTFSWWGAWLGSRPQSVVIAPGFVVREGKAWWGFDGLLPERWIKV